MRIALRTVVIASLLTICGAAVVLTTSTTTNAARFATAARCCQVQINPPPSEVPAQPPGRLTLVSCDARAERVVLRNETSRPISLASYTLHDRHRNFQTVLDQWGVVAAGASLTILSGSNPVPGASEVVWLDRPVWNNDGDEATLIAPDGNVSIVSC